jgi:hypothetical protein
MAARSRRTLGNGTGALARTYNGRIGDIAFRRRPLALARAPVFARYEVGCGGPHDGARNARYAWRSS